LTPRERVVIEVSVLPRIKDLKAVQLDIPIREAITNAYFIKGITNVTSTDITKILVYVVKTLIGSFSTYRVPEICQAIELGARGELFSDNDMNTVSPENIFKWIHRYNDKIKREAIDKQRHYEDKLEKEKEESQHLARIKLFEDEILAQYDKLPEVLENVNYGLLASYYRHLDKKGLIKLTLERKKEIFATAEKMKEEDTKEAAETFTGIKIEYTAKEIAEANALKVVFKEWKEIEIDLAEELKAEPF